MSQPGAHALGLVSSRLSQHQREDKTGFELFKLSLRSCVAPGKCCHLSEPQFLFCELGFPGC